MSSVCLLSLNNITNYLFAQQILAQTDYNLTCLVLDEPLDIINNLKEKLDPDNRITLVESTLKGGINDQTLAEHFQDCQYAFLDTHYWRHSDPQQEVQEWKLLTELFGQLSLKKILITRYEDTRAFCQKTINPIGKYNLPHWDARAEGIHHFTYHFSHQVDKHQVENFIYLYPAIFYDQLVGFLKSTDHNLERSKRGYQISLPLADNDQIYAIDRMDYTKIVAKLLISNNLCEEHIYNYKLTGELLDMTSITEMLELHLGKKCQFLNQKEVGETNNLLEREWFNYFIINKNYYQNPIMRDTDLTKFLLPNMTCFYLWLKALPNWIDLYHFSH